MNEEKTINKNIDEVNQEMQHPDYQDEIASIIKTTRSPKILKDKLSVYHESDIAKSLDILSRDDRVKLYHALDVLTLASILDYTDDLSKYFKEMSTKGQISILSNIESDTAAEYLDKLDENERKILIDLMDDESKKDIELISSFEDSQIGSRMTTDFIYIKEDVNIKSAMKEVIKQAADIDDIMTIYVIDEDETYSGAIDLKDLIRAREDQKLDDLIISSYPYIYAEEYIDDCIEDLKQYQEDSIPVLDSNNKIIGVITSSDLVEVVNEELTEDYAKLAGLINEEDLKEPLLDSIKKRLPWLIVLLLLGLVVSTVVSLFENVVMHIAILISFQSLILDMAGNVGTQSLAVTIRVLTGEDLEASEKMKFILKEVKVGFINGLILGVISFIFSSLYMILFKSQIAVNAFFISVCVSIALICSMSLASLAGTVIPMFFKKIDMDPAVVSGPLITTINDLVAVVTYYGMAWILLIKLLKIGG